MPLRAAPSYVAVTPPSGAEGDKLPLSARLARNLAVLTGVDVPDHPAGRTWVGRYGDMTVADLSRGWPRQISPAVSKAEPEPSDLPTIANASLHRFGPETKAALVLAGANDLFASVEQAMVDVIEVLGTATDGQPVADATRILMWASLIIDVYQAQPALFAASVQARTVQRAATAEWWPVTTRERRRKMEFSSVPNSLDPATHPYELGVVDRLVRDHVRPRNPIVLAETEGGGPSARFLNDSLVDRWLRHLLYSVDRGMPWVAEDRRGDFVEVFVPRLGALSSFAADVQGQFSQVLPLPETPHGSPDDNFVVFRKVEPDHVRRMIPRTPSLAEFTRLPRSSQEAAVRTAVNVLRVLRDASCFSGPEMSDQTGARFSEWVALARDVLGPGDPVTHYVSLFDARARLTRGRDSDDGALAPLREDVLRAHAALRRDFESNLISHGQWIENLNDLSPALNAMIQDLDRLDEGDLADQVRQRLQGFWSEVLSDIGIDLDRPGLGALEHQLGLGGLLHNYIGLQVRQADLSLLLDSLRVGETYLLPVRRQVAAQRGSDNALRSSLQVLLRGTCRALRRIDPGEPAVPDLIRQVRAYSSELERTSLASALDAGTEIPNRISHHLCLSALLEADLTLAAIEGAGELRMELITARFDKATRAILKHARVARLANLGSSSARVVEFRELVRQFTELGGAIDPDLL